MSTPKQNKTRTGVNRDFEANVASLLAAGPSGDGDLEVARAIAATSQKVSVDITTVPFTTVPADLFDRTFDDPDVAINTPELMRAFKAQLASKLKSIRQLINDNIPNNPSLDIGLVVQFVFAALHQGGGQ